MKGIVEVDDTYFRRSFEGSRQWQRADPEAPNRPLKQRGGRDVNAIIPALVARDRSGNSRSFVLPNIRILDEDNRVLGCKIVQSITPNVQERGIVVAAGNHPSFSGNGRDVVLPGTSKDGHPLAKNTIIAGCDADYINVGSSFGGHNLPCDGTVIRQTRARTPVNLIAGKQTNTDSQPNAAFNGSFQKWIIVKGEDVGPRF